MCGFLVFGVFGVWRFREWSFGFVGVGLVFEEGVWIFIVVIGFVCFFFRMMILGVLFLSFVLGFCGFFNKYLVEFRVGKMLLKGIIVILDKRKGFVYI